MAVRLRRHELGVLTRAMQFLSSSDPWFLPAPPHYSFSTTGRLVDVIAVCGNWYDLPHKASELASAARALPAAEILLTGGRAERLTPAAAVALGGEPLLLRRELLHRHGVPATRIVLWSGSQVTTHNLRAALHLAKQIHEFRGQHVRLVMVEEGFLVRREAATLARLLLGDAEANASVHQSFFRAVGPLDFPSLLEVHSGRTEVALALVIGELDRLLRYTRQGNTTTTTHGTVAYSALFGGEALSGMPTDLAIAIAKLQARHQGVIERGKRILESMPRKVMLELASPANLTAA